MTVCFWQRLIGVFSVQLPLKIDDQEKATLQGQIFDQIRQMILDGRLRSGDFLPTTRALSEQISVSRNTTIQAYERLAAEGYICTRPYVGTFVATDLPEFFVGSGPKPIDVVDIVAVQNRPAPEPHLEGLRAHSIVNPHAIRLAADFWVGRPAREAFPLKQWSNIVWRRLSGASDELTEYRDPAGYLELRQAIADHLGPARGMIVEPDQVIVVGGAQDGLNLIARLLLGPGSTAVVECPCYQGAAFLFESLGVEVQSVRVDQKGIDVAKMPGVPGAIAYVTPSHQYPLGVTLSLDRRVELLNWAMRNGGYIVEDDYDSDFRFLGSPLTALMGLDKNSRVFYLGTFSKCMGPALRLGFAVVPRAFVEAATALKTLMSNGQPWLEQAAMADFMLSGGYSRHLRRLRQLYLGRRNATLASLKKHFGEVEIVGAEAAMHLVWRLPATLPPANEMQKLALGAGVGIYTLNSGAAIEYEPDADSDRYIVLGFAALSESEIELGISRLRAALDCYRGEAPNSKLSVFRKAFA